jgi:cell wall-associated NlpC family hydrolase
MTPCGADRNCFVILWFAVACAAHSSAQQPTTQPAAALASADRAFFAGLARKIEPDLQGESSRLNQYIRFYQQELANDARLFAFQVTASEDANQAKSIRLSGYVEFPEHRTGVANLLRVLGFEILANDTQVLRFGLLTASSSLSFDRPSGKRTVVTECLIGEPLFLLKKSEQHYLCHSGEGYLGYVAERDILPVNEIQFASYLAGNRVIVREARRVGDRVLPAGAQLKLIQQNDGEIQAELPDGTAIIVSPPQCVVQPVTTPTIDQIVATGESFLGTQYLWGGKTNQGIDCSGLVQVAFQAAGFHLPRDSNQQVFLGSLSATRWCTTAMRRGDTMYFLGQRGRIRHTAIYLGDGLYLHAVSPVVRVASLDPTHPDYDARRHASFAFAKRLID